MTVSCKTPAPAGFAGLYIHIPFCLQKCPYCDFYSITDLSLLTAYLEAVEKEMSLRAGDRPRFDTLYIGGGTPSVLAPDSVTRLIRHARTCFQWDGDAEITLEINPGTVDADRMKGFLEAGVNRLSIGVQSFQDRYLNILGRIHTGREALRALETGRAAGCGNLGVDLIYGAPGQDRRDWHRDLETAVEAGVDHLSCYMLACEPGTPMGRDMARGRFIPAAEDAVADLYEITVGFLTATGFEQYEISNFARRAPNGGTFRSRHNVKYWTFDPYVGLGASAHSFARGKRWWNRRDAAAYIAGMRDGASVVAAGEWPDRDQQITEALYLGLRQNRGIVADEFHARFELDFERMFRPLIRALRREGYMTTGEGRYCLTIQGMLRLDAIAARFVEMRVA